MIGLIITLRQSSARVKVIVREKSRFRHILGLGIWLGLG
jgi:hypothetical protein